MSCRNKKIVSLLIILVLSIARIIFALERPTNTNTFDSTGEAKINLYIHSREENTIPKEKPILLVHGFNSSGSIWYEKTGGDYVSNFTKNGYDVIVLEMRGNEVDSNNDGRRDRPIPGRSWGYSVRDLGDDVGTAIQEGLKYFNTQLNRDYKKADVITHSTGGLAVTSYSRSLGLIPYRNDIDTLIQLAPPNNGSTGFVANIKEIANIMPALFAQSIIAYEFAIEMLDEKVWVPGGRFESERLREELTPNSLFLKSIEDLGPDPRIKTFIGIGSDDWVVGDWSPVINGREDIGYEYFQGLDHFGFYNSQNVIGAILDRLGKGDDSLFFSRYKPFKRARLLSFLSGPGIDHPDDTFDITTFAKDIRVSPQRLFEMTMRLASRKGKKALFTYWKDLESFKEAQADFEDFSSGSEEDFVKKWDEVLVSKNKEFHQGFNSAMRENLETPDIAILANGYYQEMVKLILEKLGEPVRVVDADFSPSILKDQAILIIPSGGLSGLDSSRIFRKKLSEFVENGGTLIVLSQQSSYEFNCLPGGGLKGYGWQEDESCYYKAAFIENFHPIFSSQIESYPNLKMDGYFTQIPSDSKVLLRRAKNSMPAMVLYPFGKGEVLVSALYSDWGYVNGQAQADEINLVKDLIKWSKSKSLRSFKKGEEVELKLHLNNLSEEPAKRARFLIRDNEGNIREDLLDIDLDKDKGIEIELRPGIFLNPGIWSIDYILLDSQEKIIQPQTEAGYFSITDPPEGVTLPNFSFSITSDEEAYPIDSEVIFKFHIKNLGDSDERIKCIAKSNHHNVDFTKEVMVLKGSESYFELPLIVKSDDILSANFYNSQNFHIGYAERGIRVFSPLLYIEGATDKDSYQKTETVGLSLKLKNLNPFPYLAGLEVSIFNPENEKQFDHREALNFSSDELKEMKIDFNFDEEAIFGTYKVKIDAYNNSNKIATKTYFLNLPEPELSLEVRPPNILGANELEKILFILKNPFDFEQQGSILKVNLLAPDSKTVWQENKELESFSKKEERIYEFQVPVPLPEIGVYKLGYILEMGNKNKMGEIELPFSIAASLNLKNSSFKAGESLEGEILLYPKGRFKLDTKAKILIEGLQEVLEVPVSLNPNIKERIRISKLLPDDISAGEHKIRLILETGKPIEFEWGFFISQSNLRIVLDEDIFSTNQKAKIILENPGGVSTEYEVSIKLKDSKGIDIKEEKFFGKISQSAKDNLFFEISEGLLSGSYFFNIDCLDKALNKRINFLKEIEIRGMSADLKLVTEKNNFAKTEPVSLKAVIENLGDRINDGILEIKVIPSVETGSLYGIVKDSETGEILQGAEVQIDGQQIFTNSEGTFGLNEILKGKYQIKAGFTGYEVYLKEIEILVGKNTLEIFLNKSKYGSLSGTLKDSWKKEAIIGASLVLEPTESKSYDAIIRNSVTDSSGGFNLNSLPIGKYRLKIRHPEIEDSVDLIEINEGENIRDWMVELKERYVGIEGIIRDDKGAGLFGAKVEMGDKVTYSQSDGRYFLRGIKDGGELKVNLRGYKEWKEMLDLKDIEGIAVIKDIELIEDSGAAELPEIEPNNDFPIAMQIEEGNVISSSLSTIGDEDFFKLNITMPAILKVVIKDVPDNIRPYLRVYDSKGKWLGSEAKGAGEDIEYFIELPSAGEYFIHFRDRYNNVSSADFYKLRCDLAMPSDLCLKDEDFDFAKEIKLNQEVFLNIFPEGDNDFLKFNLDGPGILSIQLKDLPSNLRPSLKLYDSNKKLIGQKAGGAGERISFDIEILQQGQYFLQIKDWYNNISSLNPYCIKIDFINSLDRYEPNNSLDENKNLILNLPLFANISPKSDEDYFRLSIPDAGQVKVNVADVPKNIRPYLKIYSDPKRSYIFSNAGGAGEETGYTFDVPGPSNYYLSIQDRYNSESSVLDYKLKAIFVPKRAYSMDETSYFEKSYPGLSINKLEGLPIEIPALEKNGKFFILGRLYSNSGMEISRALLPIYVIDSNLKMEVITDKEIYRPDEEVKINVKILNNSGEMLQGLALSLRVDDEEFYREDFDIGSLQTKLFNASVRKGSSFVFSAVVADITLRQNVEIEPVKLSSSFSIPDIAGSEAFNIDAVIKNNSRVEGKAFLKLLKDSILVETKEVHLSANQEALTRFEETITKDTHFEIISSGDLNEGLSKVVKFGEALEIKVENKALYEEGLVLIPFELHNTGELDLDFDVDFRLKEFEEKRHYNLPKGITFKDSLEYELSEGEYALFYSSKYFSGDETFKVYKPKEEEKKEESLPKLADIKIISFPGKDLAFKAGSYAKFSFKFKNFGDLEGSEVLEFKAGAFFEETKAILLEAGKEAVLDFEFLVSEDSQDGEYIVEYNFRGEAKNFTFKILGLKLEVQKELKDSVLYLKIKDLMNFGKVSLKADIKYRDYEEAKDFVLDGERELNFEIPFGIDKGEKVYFGIYSNSGKALFLDSISSFPGKEEMESAILKIIDARLDKSDYKNLDLIRSEFEIEANMDLDAVLAMELLHPDGETGQILEEPIKFKEGRNVFSEGFQFLAETEGLQILKFYFYDNTKDELLLEGSLFFDFGIEVSLDLNLEKDLFLEEEEVIAEVSIFSSDEVFGRILISVDDEVLIDEEEFVEGLASFSYSLGRVDPGEHMLLAKFLFLGRTIEESLSFKVQSIEPPPKPNHTPILHSIPDREVTAGEIIDFYIEATDIDGDVLNFSAENLPLGAVFDKASKHFRWQPGYKQIGEFIIIFKVDDGKLSDTKQAKIFIRRANPIKPIVKALAWPMSGMAPLEVNFDAEALDLDGDIVKYQWDFDGKGIYDFSSLESGKVNFVYTGEGNFPATLRVTDDDGLTETYSVMISVLKNPNAPEAILDASVVKGVAPLRVSFIGEAIDTNYISKYEWDFEGDGRFEVTTDNSKEVVKTFGNPGLFKVCFRATNVLGLSDSEEILIEVIDPGDLFVKAKASKETGRVPLEVEFDGEVESVTEIQKFQWDFEGDGNFDWTSREGCKVTHIYREPGLYEPTLRITDKNNLCKEDKLKIRAAVLNLKNLKRPKLIADVKKGKAPLTVNFNFKFELDEILDGQYFWDLDGDGMWELITEVPEATFTYKTSGVYIARAGFRDSGDIELFASTGAYVNEAEKNGLSLPKMSDGDLYRKVQIESRKMSLAEMEDGTRLLLPADTIDSNDSLLMWRREEVESPIIFKKQAGEYREFSFENGGPSMEKEAILEIPYKDIDNDGVVDEELVDELTLDAYWFNEGKNAWELISDTLIFPDINIIRIKTNHFSLFGLAGEEVQQKDSQQEVQDSGSGGGGSSCFIATVVFGSGSEEVKTLYRFRDEILIKNYFGKDLIELYYFVSPPIADFIKERPILKAIIWAHLKVLVEFLRVVL